MNDNSYKVIEVDINEILPNRFQPRIQFDEEEILELSDSIKEHGVIQPLVVRTIGDKYEIIAGERRYKASVLAGKETVPVIIKNLNDKDSAEIALIENIQRKNLTPIEEALSYKKILDMGYLTQESLAIKLGKSQSSVANKIRLLNLSDEVQEALLDNKISERHARSLLRLKTSTDQNNMLDRITKERLTVRKTDEEIDNILNSVLLENKNETKEIGKGEINMNNEISNNQVNQSTSTFDIFGDSQKTLNQAFNINPSLGQSIPSMDPIISTSQQTQVAEMQTVTNEIPSMNQFGMMGMQNGVEAVQQTPAVEMQTVANEIPSMNQFGMMGMQNGVEAVQQTPAVEMQTVANEIPSMNQFGMMGMQNGVEAAQQTPVAEMQTVTNEIPSMNQFGMMGIQNGVEAVQQTPAVEVQTVANEIPSMNQFGMMGMQNGVEAVQQTPAVEMQTVTNEIPSMNQFGMINDVNTAIPSTDALEIPNIAPIIESQTVNTTLDSEQNVETYTKPEPIIITDYSKQYDPIMPQNVEIHESKADFKEVINAIRECSQKIEKYGYKLDVEEYDLANLYQVIFKIEK